MKDHKKKAKAILENESEFDETIDALIEGLVNNANTHLMEEQDPFDLYMHRMRAHLYVDLPSFRERFAKGHRALIEEIRIGAHRER